MRGRGLLSKPHSATNRHEALKCFEQAFDGDPRSVDAKYGIANVLMSNVLDGWALAPEQDKARAEQLLTEILRDDANNSDAHANMGMLRRAQGRLNDARIELEIAIALGNRGKSSGTGAFSLAPIRRRGLSTSCAAATRLFRAKPSRA